MDPWHLLRAEQITWEVSAVPARTWSILCAWRKIWKAVAFHHGTAEIFFHAKILSFSHSGTDLTSPCKTRGRLVLLKSLTGSPTPPGQACCSRILIQNPLHAFVFWDQILKGLGRFLMCVAARIVRTTDVWTCENTFLVPYTCECCAMDVAEVGQSKEQCQMVPHPLWLFPSALAGPWQAGASRLAPAAQGGSLIPLWCGVREGLCQILFLWGQQWSHLCWIQIWRGLGETKLLWLPDPLAEDVDSCSQAHKSGWVCCSPLRPCCHVCCIYIMLDFISYFGWLKCC